MTVRIVFDAKNGTAVRDGDSDEVVQKLIESKEPEITFVTGTANVIESMRLALAENKIESKDVIFIFNDLKLINHGTSGIMYWPDGFCDHSRKRLTAIAQAERKKD